MDSWDRNGLMTLYFPLGGLDVSVSLDRQLSVEIRPGVIYSTSPWVLNVRGVDAATGSRRGGSRPGLVRFVDEPMGG